MGTKTELKTSTAVTPERPSDPHAVLRNPFDPKIGTFRDNIRLALGDLTELRESMRAHGWVKEFPALIDENGVVLVGNRRLTIAKELGIEPVTKTITLGFGDAADAERFKLAITSNVGAVGLSTEERKRLAAYLYKDLQWSQQRVAEALSVDQKTVSRNLDELGIVPNSKKGRPKGSGAKPKTQSAPKPRHEPTESDHMAAIARAFASGEPFTAHKAAKEIDPHAPRAPTYALELLQKMQDHPVDGFIAAPVSGWGATENAEWRLVLADIDLKALMQEPEPAGVETDTATPAVEAAPPPEPMPPRPAVNEITPAAGGMVPLVEVELHLGGIAADLDRLAERDGSPAIKAVADELHVLLAGWRGGPSAAVVAFPKPKEALH